MMPVSPSSVSCGPILQIKMRLLGISPMVWRRVLVPEAYTLLELHGVIQAAMGWESCHLFEFRIRAVRHGSWQLSARSPDAALESFRFRRNEKLTYVYDMTSGWEHEIRLEDRLDPDARQRYPLCIGGSGACPPEDCGGPDAYLARRDDAIGYDAWRDLETIADLVQEAVVEGKPEVLDDEDRLWQLERAVERSRARERFLASGFSRHEVNRVFAQACTAG